MGNDIVLLGGLLLDRYFYIDRWPDRGQDGFLEREESFVGGCSINMAVTIHNLGGYAHIATCIGDDQTGRDIQCYLDDHGLSSRLVYSLPGATGSCLVFSEPEGERTFLTHTGVETIFPHELAQDILSLAPAWVGVTGYYLLGEEPSCILDCLEELYRNGARILFDPSPLAGDIQPEILERMVRISDILTPNLTELPALGGENQIQKLVDAGKTVILKRGAFGGIVYAPDQVFDYAGVPCKAVDTTGAGDSFSGALLYAMSNHDSLQQGVDLAARSAAKTCEVCGPHGFWKLEESNHA